MGEYKVIDILAICQKVKFCGTYKMFVNTGLYGAGNFKSLLLLQFVSNLSFIMHKAVIRVYKVMNILAICQKLKILWHFEVLTWESMGEPKMWNISKTADRRAKLTKSWDSGYYSAHT